jgi:hypothetical protein
VVAVRLEDDDEAIWPLLAVLGLCLVVAAIALIWAY